MASTDPQKLRLGGMALRNGLLIHAFGVGLPSALFARAAR